MAKLEADSQDGTGTGRYGWRDEGPPSPPGSSGSGQRCSHPGTSKRPICFSCQYGSLQHIAGRNALRSRVLATPTGQRWQSDQRAAVLPHGKGSNQPILAGTSALRLRGQACS